VSQIKCRNRQFEKVPKSSEYLKLNRQRVGDAHDEAVGMSEAETEEAVKAWEEEGRINPKKIGKSIPGYIYRRYRSRPLLILYLLRCVSPDKDAKNADKKMSPDKIDTKVFAAIGLSFPDFNDLDTKYPQAKVSYRLNKIAIQEIFGAEDDDDDSDED
jgi:hypothetical protein